MNELGIEVSPSSVAQHYGELLNGFVLDIRDAALAERFPIPVEVIDTLMTTPDDSERVAQAAIRCSFNG